VLALDRKIKAIRFMMVLIESACLFVIGCRRPGAAPRCEPTLRVARNSFHGCDRR
jgi:hypothetical protein